MLVNLLGPSDGGWMIEVKSTRVASSFGWDFGDATPILVNGFEVTHTYSAPGAVTIKVTAHTEGGDEQDEISFTLPDGNGQMAEVKELPKRKRKVA